MSELKFNNSDIGTIVSVNCDRESVPHIMAWYGAYFAGDRYFVTFDGGRVAKDMNGEPLAFRG